MTTGDLSISLGFQGLVDDLIVSRDCLLDIIVISQPASMKDRADIAVGQ
jgi:hypothetical protein